MNRYKRLLNKEVSRAAVLTPSQFKRLLIEAGSRLYGERNVSIIWHSFGSALRVTEIALLKVADVLEYDGSVKKMGQLRGSYTKNGKPRVFFQVEEEQHDAIRRYVEYRLSNELRLGKKPDIWAGLDPKSPFYIARGVSGFSLTPKRYTRHSGDVEEYWVCSSLQQLITDMIVSIGVVGGSSHSGRRTMATRLDARGVSDELKQIILGHSDPQQTMAYIEPDRPSMVRAMARIYGDLD